MKSNTNDVRSLKKFKWKEGEKNPYTEIVDENM